MRRKVDAHFNKPQKNVLWNIHTKMVEVISANPQLQPTMTKGAESPTATLDPCQYLLVLSDLLSLQICSETVLKLQENNTLHNHNSCLQEINEDKKLQL